MADRPIIFSAPMVRALLDGRKTQTRRIIKGVGRDNCIQVRKATKTKGGLRTHVMDAAPYAVGDRLWVRETWSHTGTGVWTINNALAALDGGPVYRATDPEPAPGCWWPSIHMPRVYSRLTLEVKQVRVQRLQDITEADARAEGCGQYTSQTKIHRAFNPYWKGLYKPAFMELWSSINGPESWDADPWVVAVTFDVIHGNIDRLPAAEAAVA